MKYTRNILMWLLDVHIVLLIDVLQWKLPITLHVTFEKAIKLTQEQYILNELLNW